MRQIATGVSNFEVIVSKNSFYVDKTLFIKDFISSEAEVTLITRPRRFGKSLTLSMLDNFLNITKDSKELFKNLNISKYDDIINNHLNKYPIIHLDFKELKSDTKELFFSKFFSMISSFYILNDKYIDKNLLIGGYKKDYDEIFNNIYSIELFEKSLKFLTYLFKLSFCQKPIIIIDEYDVPLEHAYMKGYYDDIITSVKTFLVSALKSNEYLEKALIIGCSKVAQSGMFSDLNNLSVCTLLTERYNQYFGFTENEVKETLKEYNLSEKFEEVKYWYDGYNVGGISIYNPWSITNYLDSKKFTPYWVNTSSNSYLKEMLKYIKYENLLKPLIDGEAILVSYKDSIDYNKKNLSQNEIISLLFQAGYLTKVTDKTFKIVNHEVLRTFEDTFAECFISDDSVSVHIKSFFSNLIEFRIKDAEENFKETIKKAIYNDHESYYYAILDQMSYAVINLYSSYREMPGISGRSDFILKDKYGFDDAYIIEVKKVKDTKDVNETIISALKQIDEKGYAKQLENEGYQCIHKIALVINGYDVFIRFKYNTKINYSRVFEYIVDIK